MADICAIYHKKRSLKYDIRRRRHILTLPRSDRRSLSWRKPRKCHDIFMLRAVCRYVANCEVCCKGYI